MAKTGIKRIGFAEQNEVSDAWVQQEEQQSGGPNDRGGVIPPSMRYFSSIDQKKSNIEERSSFNESGKVFDINLAFVVRTQSDIDLGKKYLNRPLVLYVWTVDGKRHVIGTKQYPAYLESDNRYENTSNRELALTSQYQSTTSLLK